MTRQEDSGISILVKIAGLSSVFVLTAIFILVFMSIFSMHEISLESALIMAELKIRGDIASFRYELDHAYGALSLHNGTLIDAQGQPLNERYDLVDQLSYDLGIVATIFVREGADYRRITTSIRDTTGQRAINTLLGTGSAAYKTVGAGQLFIGNANILGKSHLTGYQPLFAPHSTEVIGILFVGIEISTIETLITQRIAYKIRLMTSAALLILVIAIALNILVFRQVIVRPIRTVADMLKAISEEEGDLTCRLTVKSRDEIGAMVRYFNLTFEKIRNLISLIKEESLSLRQNGGDLSIQMTENTAAINEITANLQSLKGQVVNQSAGIIETNATMEQISAGIFKLNEHLEQQSSWVTQSSSAMEATLAQIETVTQTLIKNADGFNALSAASEDGRLSLQEVAVDIQEIISASQGLVKINGVMENIASQTNLLSMNAAIEAAHAGAAGKGFAVVAGEIRKLSESSAEQSKTIAAVLQKITASIEKIGASAAKVLEKFEAIDAGIKTVSVQEEAIRNVMEAQNAGSKRIVDAIAELTTINQLVKNGSAEMLTRSREIIRESANLRSISQQLSDGMSEMAIGAEQINITIHQVNDISGRNKTSIDLLVQEIERFKIA
ncbi:MAG: methyl-accepting chemotaxis protein [Spirochaetaceae bacterium]|jgi:methyl-accepting chemotaxis protein|nr:methyl-accepting chemotaxis protein [Spirochaetaceae bacterium]